MIPETTTPETTTKRRACLPLTPQQERMQRAIIARLDALLTKHEPEVYPQWRAMMAEKRTKPVSTRMETCMLMACTIFSGFTKHFLDQVPESGYFDEYLEGTSRFGRIARRNERLLARLVLRGCQARGEY